MGTFNLGVTAPFTPAPNLTPAGDFGLLDNLQRLSGGQPPAAGQGAPLTLGGKRVFVSQDAAGVHVRLPDGRQRDFPPGTTNAQIAADPALRQALGLPLPQQQVVRQLNAAVDPYGTLGSISRGEPPGGMLQLAPGHSVRVVRQGVATTVYIQDGRRLKFKAAPGGTGPSDNELIASGKVRQAAGLPPMPDAQKAQLLAPERNPLGALAPVISPTPVVKPGEAQPSSPLTLKEGRVVKQVHVGHASGQLVLTRPDGKTMSLDNMPTAALPLLPEVRKFVGLPPQPAIGSQALAEKAAKALGIDWPKLLGETGLYAAIGRTCVLQA